MTAEYVIFATEILFVALAYWKGWQVPALFFLAAVISILFGLWWGQQGTGSIYQLEGIGFITLGGISGITGVVVIVT